MPWKKLLACVTGQIDETLRQKLEFVLEENRVYRALLERHSPHWRLQDAERKVLAEKGKPLGKLLADVITMVQPETLLKWHRQRVAQKWDFSSRRHPKPGRMPVSVEIEKLVLQFARENPSWGYDRIVGALTNLGYHISDQTVGNILQRQGLGPAPERKRHTTWAEFIRRHTAVLWATDFFTAEVWTPTGLTTCYVLFFLHLQTRRVILAGITPFPNEAWLKQIARNVTADDAPMANARFLLHDRDAKFSDNFDAVFHATGIQALKLPPQSPIQAEAIEANDAHRMAGVSVNEGDGAVNRGRHRPADVFMVVRVAIRFRTAISIGQNAALRKNRRRVFRQQHDAGG